MKSVSINNKTFGLVTNFKHSDEARRSFNALTTDTYGFDFEDWYQSGYWGDRYIPYSLMDGGRVISNVSVNKIEFIIDGERKVGIQIGTVMTDEKYRNQGLNKFIMELVLEEWKDKSDFIYLFANDSVLDFYPKFNFKIIDEYQHSKLIGPKSTVSNVQKLNTEDASELKILLNTINKSLPISKISMRDNSSLIMFYCTSFMKHTIYYVDALKSVVIADFEEDTLYINDVFSSVSVRLNDIIAAMAQKDTKKVVLGFTPIDDIDYKRNLLKEEDTTLFVFKDNIDLFGDKQWMFPKLSHA